MIDPAVELIVKLKYDILSRDRSTWHLSKTYPREARLKWSLRCAISVEYLAANSASATYLINNILQHRRYGITVYGEISKIYVKCYKLQFPEHQVVRSFLSAVQEINEDDYAVQAAYWASLAHRSYTADYWTKCTQWLIEELCDYEDKK